MPLHPALDPAAARRARGQLRLAEHHAEAVAANVDPWEFALSIDVLHGAAGLTLADLRWLVAQGYAETVVETTVKGRNKRSFRRGRQPGSSAATCFVATDAGIAAARRMCALLAADGAGGGAKPAWDEATGVLSFHKVPVLTIKRGDVLLVIVRGFHVLDWPTLIDDPSRRYAGDHGHRLRNAINRLNDAQSPRRIRFFCEGRFGKIGWFPLPSAPAVASPS